MKQSSLHRAAAAIDTLTRERDEARERIAQLERERDAASTLAAQCKTDAEFAAQNALKLEKRMLELVSQFTADLNAAVGQMKR